jgi:hypothetical protein
VNGPGLPETLARRGENLEAGLPLATEGCLLRLGRQVRLDAHRGQGRALVRERAGSRAGGASRVAGSEEGDRCRAAIYPRATQWQLARARAKVASAMPVCLRTAAANGPREDGQPQRSLPCSSSATMLRLKTRPAKSPPRNLPPRVPDCSRSVNAWRLTFKRCCSLSRFYIAAVGRALVRQERLRLQSLLRIEKFT